jgi:putative transposase
MGCRSVKKGSGLFHSRQSCIKVIVQMKKADQKLNLSHLCQLFDVPVSSYYYQPVDKPNDTGYREKLTVIHNENLQAYGKRRMKVSLADYGVNLGVFKIARLMKQAGIIAKVPKKPHYYLTEKQKPNSPNELKRQFNPPQVNTHWVGDITYIRHHQGWSYLATVIDLGSREIVGYALSQTPDAQLARQALITGGENSTIEDKPTHVPLRSRCSIQR